MKAIGEDPQEFAQFRDGFRSAINLDDDLEDLLACKMVEARWRQFRLLRAEAAILAQGRYQFVMERRGQLAEPLGRMNKVAGAAAPLTWPVPTTGLPFVIFSVTKNVILQNESLYVIEKQEGEE